MTFKDLFSGHASDYARYRPRYPAGLYDHLASLCERRDLAWDCATGNGQAAIELAKRFARVIATDASKKQLDEAPRIEKIEYQVWPAEKTELSTRSVDLVTVAQALHWFDFARFGQEVRRVASPGCMLAVWTYSVAQITPEIDAVTEQLYNIGLKGFWEYERTWVDKGYEGIPLPIVGETRPRFEMKVDMTLAHWIAYLGTWSAVKKAVETTGRNPVDGMRAEFEKAWGEPGSARPVTYPLNVRIGRVS